MLESLLCARAWLAEGGIVSYGDIFYPDSAVAALIAAPGDIAIAYDPNWLDLWRMRFDDPLSDAETFATDAAGKLTEIGGHANAVENIQGQYTGLLKFSAAGWQTVMAYLDGLAQRDRDRLDTTALLNRMIANGTAISTVPVSGPWGEIDTERDIEVAEALLARFTLG